MRETLACFLLVLSACAHGASVRNPEHSFAAARVSCDAPEVYIRQGAFQTQSAAQGWLAEYRERLPSIVSDDCVARVIAFVEETDFGEHQLWISAGYAASEPGGHFDDDGTTVTLTHGRVCGGAYPSSRLTLLRLPRGRRIQHRTTGGECGRDVP